ncbi:GNAT family N-acetyltransferase, partial [Arthrobacter sp. GCM10027362]
MTATTPYPDPGRTGLRWRALTPADTEAWYGLVRRMAAADQPAWSETREDLAGYLASPANDPALTTLAGFDGGGT